MTCGVVRAANFEIIDDLEGHQISLKLGHRTHLSSADRAHRLLAILRLLVNPRVNARFTERMLTCSIHDGIYVYLFANGAL